MSTEPLTEAELDTLRESFAHDDECPNCREYSYPDVGRLVALIDAERATRQVAAPEPLRNVLHANGIGCSKWHHGPDDHALDERIIRAAAQGPEQARDTGKLREAAENVSDRRTLMDDGFWVSRKEMRALDIALGRHDMGTALSQGAAHEERGLDVAMMAALEFLRRKLVGSPPHVDAEDAYMASLLHEAEAVGRAAVASTEDDE